MLDAVQSHSADVVAGVASARRLGAQVESAIVLLLTLEKPNWPPGSCAERTHWRSTAPPSVLPLGSLINWRCPTRCAEK